MEPTWRLGTNDTDCSEVTCDYYLDTPPGVTPPATVAQWDDNVPLPLVSERIFTPGTTTAATLLETPLWYAAKWGGFVDQNENNMPDLQSEWDSDGDGVPDTYFYVVNPLKLEQQLNRTFSDILSRGVSHVAPVVSVDEANRTQSGDRLYMAFFKPIGDNYWQGNLKKYGLDYRVRDDCGRTDPRVDGRGWFQRGQLSGCDSRLLRRHLQARHPILLVLGTRRWSCGQGRRGRQAEGQNAGNGSESPCGALL